MPQEFYKPCKPCCRSRKSTMDELVTEMIAVKSWVITVGVLEYLSYSGVCRRFYMSSRGY
jgi:hypothetical protein